MLQANRRGFLLIDVLVGVVLFALFATAAFMTILLGQEGSLAGGDRIRAVYLSEHALEAARTLRDDDFDSLLQGTYGVTLSVGGTWQLENPPMETEDGFLTTLTLTPLGDNWMHLSAKTTWNHDTMGSGSVVLDAELTDWRGPDGGDWTTVTEVGSYVDSGSPDFFNIAVAGSYAFVTSDNDGMYVFDMSGANPQRVSSSFDLGDEGYGVVVVGSTLFVLTSDDSDELKSYDISSPTTLSSADLLDTYNLPGSSLGRALALDGTTLYVGSRHSSSSGRYEFYAFDISDPEDIDALDELHDSDNVNAISIRGDYAYLASDYDSSELRVIDISDPNDLAFATGEGYNLSDTQDAASIVAYGTGILLGREKGSAIQEFIRFYHPSGGVPTAPPGPWYKEIDETVNGIAVDTFECAAFLASQFDAKEFQIVDITDTALPELWYKNLSSGDGRAVAYDEELNRVFLVTDKGLHVFAPGPGFPASCL